MLEFADFRAWRQTALNTRSQENIVTPRNLDLSVSEVSLYLIRKRVRGAGAERAARPIPPCSLARASGWGNGSTSRVDAGELWSRFTGPVTGLGVVLHQGPYGGRASGLACVSEVGTLLGRRLRPDRCQLAVRAARLDSRVDIPAVWAGRLMRKNGKTKRSTSRRGRWGVYYLRERRLPAPDSLEPRALGAGVRRETDA
jgi:hypothetical protein